MKLNSIIPAWVQLRPDQISSESIQLTSNSELICSMPYPNRFLSLTATKVPNVLVGVEWATNLADEIYTVDLSDCSVKYMCKNNSYAGFLWHASPFEYGLEGTAVNEIDLDCDNWK